MPSDASQSAEIRGTPAPPDPSVAPPTPLPPPFRWPGGKRWLVTRLLALTPPTTGKYFEPFLGGGALFFALRPPRARLSDTNAELMACYEAIRDDHARVAAILRQLPRDEASFYKVRASFPDDRFERAARLLYLTTLAFNGIYRVNSKGEFNVPYGGRTYARLGAPGSLAPYAAALSGAELVSADFEDVLEDANPGDLVYLDPPYTVVHSNNGFVRYNDRIFRWRDQQRLASSARALDRRGCHVFVSNALHDSILRLYPTFRPIEVSRTSVMAADPSRRRPTAEYLLTNVSVSLLLAAPLYGHEPAGDGRAEWGRRQRVARSGMI